MKKAKNQLYFKIFSLVITLWFLVFIYLYHIITKEWGLTAKSSDTKFFYGDFSLHYLSLFTTQSNILVALWFLMAIINHKKEEKYWTTNQQSKIFISGYILVTLIIWFTAILPFNATNMNALNWINSLGQHLIVPALMTSYTILTIGKEEVVWKQWLKKQFWIYLIYPFAYIIYIMIRGEMRTSDDKIKPYPYVFLNYHQEQWGMNGITIFFMFFIVVFLTFVFTNLIFVYFNNHIINKKNLKLNS